MIDIEKLKLLNPHKITVDDVRGIFHISRVKARTLLEMGVSSKILEVITNDDNNLCFYILKRQY